MERLRRARGVREVCDGQDIVQPSPIQGLALPAQTARPTNAIIALDRAGCGAHKRALPGAPPARERLAERCVAHEDDEMKVCVLGAGVVGLTTAWEFAERGYEVTLVDRRRESGAETSFANGAQLSYAYVAPLAAPETLMKLPALLLSPAAPIRLRPSLDPDLARWGLKFLRACTDRMVGETTRAQLALAAVSRAALHELACAQALEFGLRQAGKIILHRKPASMEAARRQMRRQADASAGQSLLTPQETLALEPGLNLAADAFAGAVHTPSEEIGDCRRFCEELTERMRRRNAATLRLGAHVRGLVLRAGKLRAVDTSQGEIETDLVVLALGAEAGRFARTLGFPLPIYPMKGYSITARMKPGARGLNGSVTDFDRKIVYAPLTDAGEPVTRVAGVADLVGHDATIDRKRLARMTAQAADMLALDLEGDVQPWAGLRPATPDSRPIVGWSPAPGVFLNVGHGALGWTLACGAARLAADIVSGEAPCVPAEWFSYARAV